MTDIILLIWEMIEELFKSDEVDIEGISYSKKRKVPTMLTMA